MQKPTKIRAQSFLLFQFLGYSSFQAEFNLLPAAEPEGLHSFCEGVPPLTVHSDDLISLYEWRHCLWRKIGASLCRRDGLVLEKKGAALGGLAEVQTQSVKALLDSCMELQHITALTK